jgi:hypothetical protein
VAAAAAACSYWNFVLYKHSCCQLALVSPEATSLIRPTILIGNGHLPLYQNGSIPKAGHVERYQLQSYRCKPNFVTI